MSKKEDHIWEMVDFSEVVVSVECQADGCDRSASEYQTEDYYACKSFYEKGWRIIDDELLCPSCVKKHKSKPQSATDTD